MSTKEKGYDKEAVDVLQETIRRGYGLPRAYFDLDVKRATEKKDISMALNLKQLAGSLFEDFYVGLDTVRDSNTVSNIEQTLKEPLTPYRKILFSGSPGAGKTTELIKLCIKLMDDFNVIVFSASNRIKIDEVTTKPLLLETMRNVLNYLFVNDIGNTGSWSPLSSTLSYLIPDYFKKNKKYLESGDRKDLVEIRDKSDSSTPLTRLAKLLGSSDVLPSEKKKPYLTDLVFHLNHIFNHLKTETGNDVLIIIDSLEKVPSKCLRDFYLNGASYIRDLNCKMVLTFPVEFVFHPAYTDIESLFGEPWVLPTIKVKNLKGKEYQPGVAGLNEILNRRMDLSLFENHCYKNAIIYSGGSIPQLFHIIQKAALTETTDIIRESSMRQSIEHHEYKFSSKIQPQEDSSNIGFEDYMDILVNIYDGNKVAPTQNFVLLDLIRMGAVMKYFGDRYYDTHPLLDNFIKSHEKIEVTDIEYTENNAPDLLKETANGYLKDVEIRDFFCIKKMNLADLDDKKEIYFVGENGDGKTILLQAILLALKGDRNVGEIVNFTKQNTWNTYDLTATDHAGAVYRFSKNESVREQIGRDVFAYGVHRSKNDSDKADEYGYLTLFEEDQYLNNPVKWLQYLHHKEAAGETPPIDLQLAKDMLRSILNENVTIDVTPDAVTFKERETAVNFSQLADGYKSVIIWVCDLLERLSKNQPGAKSSKDFKGIVLLDEIEIFLHPKWKYKIVRNLRDWFPEIQFIFTTHSSTIILGASKDAVFYKLYKEDGLTQVSKPLSKISNLMLNAVITSPLFDLESAQAYSFEEEIPERLEAGVFKNELLDKVGEEDQAFLKKLYKKSKDDSGAYFVLKKEPNEKEMNRLHAVLIRAGLKEPLDTSSDYLYHKIHQAIEKRIATMNNVTEADVMSMVEEELDSFENSPGA